MGQTPTTGSGHPPLRQSPRPAERAAGVETSITRPEADPEPIAPPRTEEPKPVPSERRETRDLETLAARFAADSDRLRDLEKSLVERIADVDDDRRLNSAQLQRSWQTFREELKRRLNHQTRTVFVGLSLGLAATAAALITVHLHYKAELAKISADLVKLRSEQSGWNSSLTTSVSPVGPGTTDPGAPAGSTPAAKARLDKLTAELRYLTDELNALRQDLKTRPAAVGIPGPGGQTPDVPSAAAPDDNISTVVSPTAITPPGGPDVPSHIGEADATPRPDGSEKAGRPPTGDVAIADQPFAVQLIGSRYRSSLLQWLKQSNLPHPVYLYEEKLGQRPWFVLIHSLHSSRDEAAQALSQLAPDLKTRSPWIRQLPEGSKVTPVGDPTGR